MKVISKVGRDDIAVVYIAKTDDGRHIEFVESIDPPTPREKKWVNVVSTLFGCPVKCKICDAGFKYSGKLTADQILFQIDYLIKQRFPNGKISADQWKIQFARMGDPAFNHAVLEVLEVLPDLYDAPGLMPSISTVAPCGTNLFFDKLIKIVHEIYPTSFQFQFSVHSTDREIRRSLIPVKSWSFAEMAKYGEKLYHPAGRKITLNFVLMNGVPIDPNRLIEHFDPDIFLIKVTPLNPTFSAVNNELNSLFSSSAERGEIVASLEDIGYQVIVSQGDLEENAIGSNCGQYVMSLKDSNSSLVNAYSYDKTINSEF